MATDVVEQVENVQTVAVAPVQSDKPETGTVLYSSITDASFESRKRALKAVNNSVNISDNLNTPIHVVDMIAIQSEVESDRGLVQVPRTTLIDSEGRSFHAMSDVVYNDVKRIVGMLGDPAEWPEPLTVVATSQKAKQGTFLTLSIV